ncbi:MAG: amidohydrolase [Deltaproteobacteria bacterium]|nr:amidohydrolase [Deltaproteobacteria bacterium]
MQTSLSKADQKELIGLRRFFHSHPELKFGEVKTSARIQEKLKEYGYQPQAGMAKTGVYAMHSDNKGRCILLRADMDALPLQELNQVPYKSQNSQAMHACGHDMHMATLLMAAKHLKNEKISGNLKFVFQPGEEGGNGALRMIEQGILKNPKVEAAFGLHVWSQIPTGQVAVSPGGIMASVDEFELTIRGKGGHGAMPHQTIDSIVVASHVVTTLQSILSREIDPFDSVVVTIGKIQGGTTFNIIPEETVLKGTIRTMNKETWKKIPRLFERKIAGVTKAFGASYELKLNRDAPVTVNDPKMTEFVREIARDVVGSANLVNECRTMGGEDFAFILREVPGCFFFVGGRNEKKDYIHPHHSPRFNIDEGSLFVGVEMMKKIAKSYFSYFSK